MNSGPQPHSNPLPEVKSLPIQVLLMDLLQALPLLSCGTLEALGLAHIYSLKKEKQKMNLENKK